MTTESVFGQLIAGSTGASEGADDIDALVLAIVDICSKNHDMMYVDKQNIRLDIVLYFTLTLSSIDESVSSSTAALVRPTSVDTDLLAVVGVQILTFIHICHNARQVFHLFFFSFLFSP